MSRDPISPPSCRVVVIATGVGQTIGQSAFETARRMRWPLGNVHVAKCISISSGYVWLGRGLSGQTRRLALRTVEPSSSHLVTVPSGATSERRANQSASGTDATGLEQGMRSSEDAEILV